VASVVGAVAVTEPRSIVEWSIDSRASGGRVSGATLSGGDDDGDDDDEDDVALFAPEHAAVTTSAATSEPISRVLLTLLLHGRDR
jgi:hypothetical protein